MIANNPTLTDQEKIVFREKYKRMDHEDLHMEKQLKPHKIDQFMMEQEISEKSREKLEKNKIETECLICMGYVISTAIRCRK